MGSEMCIRDRIEIDCKAGKIGCVECKKNLAKSVNRALAPIREKRNDLKKHLNSIKDLIEEGNRKASKVAESTISGVRELMGV